MDKLSLTDIQKTFSNLYEEIIGFAIAWYFIDRDQKDVTADIKMNEYHLLYTLLQNSVNRSYEDCILNKHCRFTTACFPSLR